MDGQQKNSSSFCYLELIHLNGNDFCYHCGIFNKKILSYNYWGGLEWVGTLT